MSDPQKIKQDSQERMHKSIEALKSEFVKIRSSITSWSIATVRTCP